MPPAKSRRDSARSSMNSVIAVKGEGDKARPLAVHERTKHLFGETEG